MCVPLPAHVSFRLRVIVRAPKERPQSTPRVHSGECGVRMCGWSFIHDIRKHENAIVPLRIFLKGFSPGFGFS